MLDAVLVHCLASGHLLYNVVATPGALYWYRRQHQTGGRLAYGLSGRDSNTVTKCTILANTHIIPALGARKLRDLSADDVDRWLCDKAQALSTRTLQEEIGRASCRERV